MGSVEGMSKLLHKTVISKDDCEEKKASAPLLPSVPPDLWLILGRELAGQRLAGTLAKLC